MFAFVGIMSCMKPCQICVGITEYLHCETTPIAALFVAEIFSRDDFSKTKRPKNLRCDRGCQLAANVRTLLEEDALPHDFAESE